ncbi:MAG: NYN domain-containing protein [Actinobacteria bacterium]|nr:MAG: NYN domain-containing protein [Actinomycetota bacterium]
MNVIGSRPDGWWRDRRGAIEVLVDRLALRVARQPTPTTVVFDGRPFAMPAGLPAPLEVRFATRGGPHAADADIAQLVADSAHPAEILVVTSDAELAGRVRSLGARVQGAGSFRRELER